MTQQKILELAKQGDAQAIATLMNHQFQSKGILVKANNQEGCLQIIFEAIEVPQQQKFAKYAFTAVTKLNSLFIKKLIIYGKETGKEFPVWQQEFIFSTSQPSEIKQSNEIALDKIEIPSQSLVKSIEHTQDKELVTLAKNGDVHAIGTLIEQGFWSKVVVSPVKKNGILILTLKFSEKTHSEIALQVVIKTLNDLKPKDVKTVQVIGVRLWTEWSKYLSLVSGTYTDTTKAMYVSMTVVVGILVLFFGYAHLIYKPSSSAISSPSKPSRLSLGMSKTGYELLLEGSCVIVKDIKTSDFVRLNTTLEGFKEAVKQETGYQCVLFE